MVTRGPIIYYLGIYLPTVCCRYTAWAGIDGPRIGICDVPRQKYLLHTNNYLCNSVRTSVAGLPGAASGPGFQCSMFNVALRCINDVAGTRISFPGMIRDTFIRIYYSVSTLGK